MYDGVVSPPDSSQRPPMASSELRKSLRRSVALAKENGRVIEQLWELEMDPVEDSSSGETSQAGTKEDQKPATKDEMDLLNQLKAFRLPDLDRDQDANQWVMRRWGYTESENPEHMGMIMHGPKPLGTFHCKTGLSPIPTDILVAMVDVCLEGHPELPRYLHIDDKGCFGRCQFLFQNHLPAIKVLYYLPPSAEETRARMQLP